MKGSEGVNREEVAGEISRQDLFSQGGCQYCSARCGGTNKCGETPQKKE